MFFTIKCYALVFYLSIFNFGKKQKMFRLYFVSVLSISGLKAAIDEVKAFLLDSSHHMWNHMHIG